MTTEGRARKDIRTNQVPNRDARDTRPRPASGGGFGSDFGAGGGL